MLDIIFDYSKLRGKIKEVYGQQDKFAEAIGLGRVSLSQRLNNSLEFTQGEIKKSCNVLGISAEDMPNYFFIEKVQVRELIDT